MNAERMSAPPDDLDTLFALARQHTPEDALADARLIAQLRLTRSRPRRPLAWLAPLLASAAVAAGIVLVQTRDLPASTAYQVYQQASGSGW